MKIIDLATHSLAALSSKPLTTATHRNERFENISMDITANGPRG